MWLFFVPGAFLWYYFERFRPRQLQNGKSFIPNPALEWGQHGRRAVPLRDASQSRGYRHMSGFRLSGVDHRRGPLSLSLPTSLRGLSSEYKVSELNDNAGT